MGLLLTLIATRVILPLTFRSCAQLRLICKGLTRERKRERRGFQVISDQSYFLLRRLEPAWTVYVPAWLAFAERGQSTEMPFTDQSLQINQVYGGLNHWLDSRSNLHDGDDGYGAEWMNQKSTVEIKREHTFECNSGFSVASGKLNCF